MLRETQMTVSGNVTRPPELKHRKVDGRAFVIVPIAVNNRRYDPDRQQWVEEGVTYYDIICRGSLAGNALASVGVGMPVVAHGKFRLHEWTTDTAKGARPCVVADSLGVDLVWGTTAYSKGSCPLPAQPDGYDVSPPPASEGGPAQAGPVGTIAPPDFPTDDDDLDDLDDEEGGDDGPRSDEDGVVSDEEAEAYLARSA